MIAKTKLLNNIAFFPFVAVSLFMTLWLFWQFGSNIMAAILLCVSGAAVEVFKILMLLRWRNQVAMKRKRKDYFPLFVYLMIAIASCFASMSFGVKEIEKVSALQMGDVGKSEVIEMRIAQLQNQASHKNTGYIENLKKQINDLRSKIPNKGMNIIKKTKEINVEISKINKIIYAASKVRDNSSIHTKIQILKIELAEARFNSIDTKGSFKVMADVFGIRTETIMIIFLLFVTVTIEVGIASTSTGFSSGVKKKVVKKKKNNGQISIFNVVA